jgi:hypothetical protein
MSSVEANEELDLAGTEVCFTILIHSASDSLVDVLDKAAVVRHQTVTTILPICWFDSR